MLGARLLLATWPWTGRRSNTSSVFMGPVFWQLERWRRQRLARPPLKSSRLVLTLPLTMRLI